IVGVNRYRLENEPEVDILEVDNAKVRAGQIARIEKVRAGRDEAKVRAALDALTEAARQTPSPRGGEGRDEGARPPSESSSAAHPHPALSHKGEGLDTNLLALSVEAARARATLGEIS